MYVPSSFHGAKKSKLRSAWRAHTGREIHKGNIASKWVNWPRPLNISPMMEEYKKRRPRSASERQGRKGLKGSYGSPQINLFSTRPGTQSKMVSCLHREHNIVVIRAPNNDTSPCPLLLAEPGSHFRARGRPTVRLSGRLIMWR
jgi:hypothetical protein